MACWWQKALKSLAAWCLSLTFVILLILIPFVTLWLLWLFDLF